MNIKNLSLVIIFIAIFCIFPFAGNAQNSNRYIFQQNFVENNIAEVSYEEAGTRYYYHPNIGFTIGKRIIYDGFIPLLDDLIPDSALAVLNKDELGILKKTITARYGEVFVRPADIRHFNQFDWYKANMNPFKGSMPLTDNDKENIRRIEVFENSEGRNFNVNEFVKNWLYYFPVSNWTPEVNVYADFTIEKKGTREDSWKGFCRREAGFLVVYVTEQYIGNPDYLDAGWHWPSGVSYRDGTVYYNEPIKLVFPVGEQRNRTNIVPNQTVSQRRIGSHNWTDAGVPR